MFSDKFTVVCLNLVVFCNIISSEKTIDEKYNDNNESILNPLSSIGIQNKFETEIEDDLLITTGSGMVRGTKFYLDDDLNEIVNPVNTDKLKRVNAWLGIPFAQKPLDNLRFKRPEPVENWNQILNCTKLPNSCFQVYDTVIPDFKGVDIWNSNTELSEDCLYLNIWAPHPLPKNSPVLVKEIIFRIFKQ
jgi:acetylcholinesterase